MLIFIYLIGFVLTRTCSLHIKDQPQGSEDELTRLLERVLGSSVAARFEIKIDPSLAKDGEDVVKINGNNDRMVVTGTSGTAVAYGVNQILKRNHYHVSWDGDRLDNIYFDQMDEEFTLMEKYRYYMNVCTFSYSYVWWNWTRWEREIDWMALNGYNFVLAFTGTEAVWNQVYLDLGLTQSEIDDHFSGPAFLAWNRMGNLRGGTKLSAHWHRTQVALQKKILERMRNLGITPILPAFAGHLPTAITRIFPQANVTHAPRWNSFPDKNCCPAMLRPSDQLFKTIGGMFIKKLEEMYGSNHVYNCDPFNEMTPDTKDLNELASYGRAIYESMASADPEAIWVLQGWMFKHDYRYWSEGMARALLTSVEVGKMVVLDLQAELNPQYKRLNNFFGQPFIWCMLHNFGGTLGLQGAIARTKEGLDEARNQKSSNMIGVGITMEGIGTNYVVYDYFSDYMTGRVNSNWTNCYATARYGAENPDISAAWSFLMVSVYNYNSSEALHGQYLFNNRPSLDKKIKPYWYDPNYVYMAWHSLLQAATTIKNPNDLFIVDLVDVTRQGLQHKLDTLYQKVMLSYRIGDRSAEFNYNIHAFLEVLDDMDRILGTSRKFLLGVWLEDAKAMAENISEMHSFEGEARNQITLWGREGEILDYANKMWAGVVKDYFKPRWEIFFKYLQADAFDKKKYLKSVRNAEIRFSLASNLYPTEPQGNAVDISRELYEKWVGRGQ